MIHFLTESAAHLRRGLIQRKAAIGSIRQTVLADGERSYRLLEDVTRAPVTVVGAITPSAESLFDLLACFRLLRENRSRLPNIVVPYLGYARQDHTEPGEAAIGVMIGELMRNLNAGSIAVIDPHSPRVVESMGANVEVRTALPLIADALRDGDPFDVVVAPDQGAEPRARALAELLGPGIDVVIMQKTRPKPNTVVMHDLDGDVKHKRALIIDDLVDTGGTIMAAVKKLKDAGASDVVVAATHGLFTGNALEKILRLPVDGVIVTNTLPQTRHERLHVLDVSNLVANHTPSERT